MTIICNEIEICDRRVFERLPKLYDLKISVPPGTSKTTIASVFATAWELANDPSLRIFVGSFSDNAVLGIAENISLVVNSEKYKKYFPHVKILKNANTKHRFRTSDNGEFYAFTVGGTITSKHAHILKLDDHIDPKGVQSPAHLKTACDFIDKTLPSRKADKAVTPTYHIAQRLSHNDPTDHLLKKKGEGIRHICLPARLSDNVEPSEYKAIYVDGLLDPLRLGDKVLEEMESDLGSFTYNAQFMQTPSPPGGDLYKRSWFNIVEPFSWNRSNVNFYVDPSYGEKSGDATAIATYVKVYRGQIPLIYLIDIENVKLTFEDLKQHITSKVYKYGNPNTSTVYVEAKASGKSLVQSLKADYKYKMIRFKEDKIPNESKGQRAHRTSPYVQRGEFILCKGDWNAYYLNQLLTFSPVLKNQIDDQVDCTTAIIRIELERRGDGVMSKA